MKRPVYDGRADTWSEVYASADPFGRRIQRRRDVAVATVQRRLAGRHGRVLDAGCGTGAVTRRLRALGHSVVGVDLSWEMLRAACADAPRHYVRASATALPARSDSFDAVVCLGLLGHMLWRREGERWVDTARLVVAELVRVLKPGGFVLCDISNLTRLHWLLDPKQLLRGLRHRRRRQWVEAQLPQRDELADGSLRVDPGLTRRWTPWELRRFVAEQGLEIVEWSGLGLGPFTVWGRHVFSHERSVRISVQLERLARGPLLGPLNKLAATWILTLVPRAAPPAAAASGPSPKPAA